MLNTGLQDEQEFNEIEAEGKMFGAFAATRELPQKDCYPAVEKAVE